MADDILDSFLDEDIDDDIPVVVGGEKRLMQRGHIVAAKSAAPVKDDDQPEEKEETSDSVAASTIEPVEKKSRVGDLDLAGQYAEDAKEIHQVEKTELTAKINEKELADTDKMLRDLTDEAEAACGMEFADEPDEQRRFHLVVEAYFKDLRDALETKSKLTMPAASGGMGLNDEQAEKVMTTLQAKRGNFEAVLAKRTAQQKEKFVSAAAERQLNDQRRAEVKEKEDLDRRFMELTGEGPDIKVTQPPKPQATMPSKVVQVQGKTKPPAQALPPAATAAKSQAPHVGDNELTEAPKEMFAAGEGGDKEEKKVNQPTSDSPMSKYVASAGPKPVAKPPQQSPGEPPINLPIAKEEPKPSEPEPDLKLESYSKPLVPASAETRPSKSKPVLPETTPVKPSPAKLEQVIHPSTRPPAPKPKTPSASVAAKPALPAAPPVSGGKPVMSDVKFAAQRLMGPVEALRSITLKDFRRLSKDPQEATLKLKDKIDLLGDEQSFEVKTAGMKAWRESAVNKLYLEILRRSLEGVPISQVISSMESKGEDVLSKSEFDAIMKLNRDIRFG